MARDGYVSQLKSEKIHLARVREYPDAVMMARKDAVMEGFAYFGSEECKQSHPECKATVASRFAATPLKNLPQMIGLMGKVIRKMVRGRNECFSDADIYVEELETTGQISGMVQNAEIDGKLWEELKAYAWETHRVILGFTALPPQLIFKGKAVLFAQALVCILEMDKEKIMTAPDMTAGGEVLRVYASLGVAVNDIARWLRDKGIKCMSNHPLGGLVNTVPLAAKAGLGGQGRNGLLITPQYEQRQRIAPIFLQNKIFEYTDKRDHVWIEQFCDDCKRCMKACPSGAIYAQKQVHTEGVDGIGPLKTCIDRHKCFPYFNKTMGCSVCVKVCPFSQGQGSYEKVKNAMEK